MAKSRFSIIMDYQNAMRQAENLEKIAEELKQCIDNSETFKANVRGSWNGENAELYISKTEQSTERLRQIRNSVIATKDVVKRIAKRTYDSEMAALDISTKRTY